MNDKEYIEAIKRFMDRLQDEESREIFEARFDYCIHRDLDVLERKLINGAIQHGRKGGSYILDRFFRKNPDRKKTPFVIFGAGKSGRATIRSLKFLGIEVVGCVDNNHISLKTAEGLSIAPPSVC